MAVTINAQSLAHALRITDSPGTVLNTEQAATVARLLGAATALVDNYSILAPDHVANEGVVRLAGWMYDQPVGRQNADALGLSGARSMLAPWRIRRARNVEGSGGGGGTGTIPDTGGADVAVVAALIEGHRAVSNAHHEPGTGGIGGADTVARAAAAAAQSTAEGAQTDINTHEGSTHNTDELARESASRGIDKADTAQAAANSAQGEIDTHELSTHNTDETARESAGDAQEQADRALLVANSGVATANAAREEIDLHEATPHPTTLAAITRVAEIPASNEASQTSIYGEADPDANQSVDAVYFRKRYPFGARVRIRMDNITSHEHDLVVTANGWSQDDVAGFWTAGGAIHPDLPDGSPLQAIVRLFLLDTQEWQWRIVAPNVAPFNAQAITLYHVSADGTPLGSSLMSRQGGGYVSIQNRDTAAEVAGMGSISAHDVVFFEISTTSAATRYPLFPTVDAMSRLLDQEDRLAVEGKSHKEVERLRGQIQAFAFNYRDDHETIPALTAGRFGLAAIAAIAAGSEQAFVYESTVQRDSEGNLAYLSGSWKVKQGGAFTPTQLFSANISPPADRQFARLDFTTWTAYDWLLFEFGGPIGSGNRASEGPTLWVRVGRVAALQHKLDPAQTGQGTSQISDIFLGNAVEDPMNQPVFLGLYSDNSLGLAFDDESSGSGTPVSPAPLKIFGV